MEKYEIKHLVEENRFALYDGNKEIGELTYKENGNVWTLDHTLVDSAYGGQGLAAKLMDFAIATVRERKLKVIPKCSYIRSKFEKNPEEYEDISL